MKAKKINTNCRLVLGTAQLGSSYGIANRTGQPDCDSARAIVQAAWQNGIREFDTAQAYGTSEEILGRVLSELGVTKQANIITKLDPKLDHLDKSVLLSNLENSLKLLKVSTLKGLMIHREACLGFLDQGLGDILSSYVKDGLVEQIGVSVYSPEKAMQALASDLINIVQLPANIFDNRFSRAGVFDCAGKSGKKVYVRTVYLQGLLLMNPEDVTEKMGFAKPVLKNFIQFCGKFDLTPQQAALGYAKLKYPQSSILFGAETAKQVENNCSDWARDFSEEFLKAGEEMFNDVNEQIVNPNFWPK